MSLKISRKKPVQIFLAAVIVSMVGIYSLCDYYLNSVGHELMLNWVRTESALIQEGNLLTSSTKNQRFLLSSDYIRAVKLIKIDGDQIKDRLHFGDDFNVDVKDMPQMNKEVVIQRTGFLHSRAFYKIPNRDEMFLIFDVESKVLNSVFFGGIAFVLLMLIALVAVIRAVENQEFVKREEIFKQALNDFISKDRPSDLVKNALPTLMTWWKDKKDQVEAAHQLAVQNQSKIMLGEIASRVGHDIVGSVRNVEILARRTTGLNEKQQELFQDSINKIKIIAAEISEQTKKTIDEDYEIQSQKEIVNLVTAIDKVVQQKCLQYEGLVRVKLELDTDASEVIASLSSLEFERAVSNLVNNAVEASPEGSVVVVSLQSTAEAYEVLIKDTGKGISQEQLHKVGTKGFTSGKDTGTGIGVFYAKRFIEGVGGQFFIASELGKGTSVTLMIPREEKNQSHKIEISNGETLLILEDQQFLRDAIRLKLSEAPKLAYQIFSKPSDLERWLSTNNTPFRLYSDYFLEGEKETGIQVIKRLGLGDKSKLVTSAFDDEKVLKSAGEVGVDVWSKDQFFKSEIKLEVI